VEVDVSGGGDSMKAVVVAVAVNSVITVLKFAGWLLTWSPSLLAEAIHSTADVGNQFLLWIGIRESNKAATPEHPYGWGNARYLWNLKSAMGIFFLGCGVTVAHGLHHAYLQVQGGHHEEAVKTVGGMSPATIGIVILIIAVVLEGYSWWVALKEVNEARGDVSWSEYLAKGDDPTGVGVLLEDTAAVGGVLIALVGVGLSSALHSPIPDIVATLLIGGLLGWVAVFLAKANGRLLIGAAVSQEQLDLIREALESDEMVERVEDLKTQVIGPGRIRVKCEIDFYEKLIAKRIRESLKDDMDRLERGEGTMKVLVDIVGRSVRAAADEIQRLDQKVRDIVPTAAHVDLELISKDAHFQDDD
jgi:zinc transporter 9